MEALGVLGVFVVIFGLFYGLVLIFLPIIIYGMSTKLTKLVKQQEAVLIELRSLRKDAAAIKNAIDVQIDLVEQLGNAVLESTEASDS